MEYLKPMKLIPVSSLSVYGFIFITPKLIKRIYALDARTIRTYRDIEEKKLLLEEVQPPKLTQSSLQKCRRRLSFVFGTLSNRNLDDTILHF